MSELLISSGNNVLLDVNDGERFVFSRVKPAATVKIGKVKCPLEGLIGSPFGATFVLQKGGPAGALLERCSGDAAVVVANCSKDTEGDEDTSEQKDNRSLIDNNTAQSLSAEEIDNMRREGASGQQIIDALIANSTSYQSKTAFSQEKYRKKKQKKYAPRIIVRRPTAQSVCEAYLTKSHYKIGGLRVDSLSLLLSFANIRADSNVLVFDMVGGLLTAAVAERMAGFGSVCNVYFSKITPDEIVGLFNFNPETLSRIFRVPVSAVLEARSALEKQSEVVQSESVVHEETEKENGTEPEKKDDVVTAADNDDGDGESFTADMEVEAAQTQPVAEDLSPKKAKQQALGIEISKWAKEGFSSLIVAAAESDPKSIIQQLLPLLSPSSTFAVYSSYLQPLAECLHWLRDEHLAIGLQLSEPWLREYQVLPSRTHPQMQMSSSGGYVLNGIKVMKH